jgi:hypothetical protein
MVMSVSLLCSTLGKVCAWVTSSILEHLRHSHLIDSLQILQTAVGVRSSPHALQERLLGIL